ncbi:MAG: hypothetical protein ACFFDF_23955 [Candidatus Odinarchaeota archaeon]
MDKNEKEDRKQVHFWIPAKLKTYWKSKFKERGHHTLKSGIVAAVFSYLHLQGFQKVELDLFMKEIKEHLTFLEQIDAKLEERVKVANHSLDIVSEEVLEDIDYEKVEQQLLEHIKFYQPVAITFLSTLTKIPGEYLLPILKRMKDKKLVRLKDNFEWCLP